MRNGAINAVSLDSAAIEGEHDQGLMGLKLHEIKSWASAIDDQSALRQLDPSRRDRLIEWLEHKLPTIR